jgi:hypothetical protein
MRQQKKSRAQFNPRPQVKSARFTRVRIEKRDGYSVGVLDHPISEAAIKKALSEFP